MRGDILQEPTHRGCAIGSTLAQRRIREATQQRASSAAQTPGLGVNLGKQVVRHRDHHLRHISSVPGYTEPSHAIAFATEQDSGRITHYGVRARSRCRHMGDTRVPHNGGGTPQPHARDVQDADARNDPPRPSEVIERSRCEPGASGRTACGRAGSSPSFRSLSRRSAYPIGRGPAAATVAGPPARAGTLSGWRSTDGQPAGRRRLDYGHERATGRDATRSAAVERLPPSYEEA